MILSLFLCPENNESLLEATLPSASVMCLLEMHVQCFVVSVVPMWMVLSTHMTSFMGLLHVFHEGSHIEEIHLTEGTLRMVQYDLAILVSFSIF